jgi:hypothetical protein
MGVSLSARVAFTHSLGLWGWSRCGVLLVKQSQSAAHRKAPSWDRLREPEQSGDDPGSFRAIGPMTDAGASESTRGPPVFIPAAAADNGESIAARAGLAERTLIPLMSARRDAVSVSTRPTSGRATILRQPPDYVPDTPPIGALSFSSPSDERYRKATRSK